jgi:predicted RNase H-like nuclease (RuvC/YqgF family)
MVGHWGGEARMNARRTKSKTAPSDSPSRPSSGRLADAVTALEREREALKAELAEAKSRIAELEKARREALDRVDWAIDSLKTALQRAE